MPTETSGRPLLPQTAQMQSFTFAPPTLAPRENQRSESPAHRPGGLPANRDVQTMYL
jgi:hypothetical protein